MSAGIRVKAKRTTGSGPPPGLLFGEMGYSDADQQFYIGRADTEQPPTTFGGSSTDYSAAIANLTNDLATLDSSQAAQGQAIELLTTASDSQADAIAAIATEQDSQDAAISVLATVNSEQAAAITALLARPSGYGFTYDQQAEPLTPTAGQTWRERSNAGLIVGAWEWSGSLWLSVAEYDSGGVPEIGSIGPNTVFRASIPFKCLLSRCVIRVGRGATYNSTNYFNFQVRGVAPAAVAAIGPLFTGNNAEILATPSGGIFEASIALGAVFNSALGGANPMYVWVETSAVGAPSSLVRGTAVYSYRRIR